MNIAKLIRRTMMFVFMGALLLGGFGTYVALKARALEEAALESRILLAAARAARSYTSEQLTPILRGDTPNEFHPQSVPSYTAQAIFDRVTEGNPAYTYREVALNPTSPADLPEPFETELINRFRADSTLEELSGLRGSSDTTLFYLARPIRIEDESCLACHSTPDNAPASMVATYGPINGFGWQMDEAVGVQVLTVPVAHELRGAYEMVLLLGSGLFVILMIAYIMISGTIQHHLVDPLAKLTRRAEDASIGSYSSPDQSTDGGSSELLALSNAITRLQSSLRKALAGTASTNSDDS
jgi:hypothetical protein